MKSSTLTIRVRPEARHAAIDLTDDLRRAIKDSGVTDGCAVAFCAHTTCALVINEWEEGALADFRQRLESLVPQDIYYAHDDLERRTQNLQEGHERANRPVARDAHAPGLDVSRHPRGGRRAAVRSVAALILFELDEPKDRDVVFHVFGE